mgnify:CR=1 FL=1
MGVRDDKEGDFSEENNVASIQGEKKIRISWVGKRKH